MTELPEAGLGRWSSGPARCVHPADVAATTGEIPRGPGLLPFSPGWDIATALQDQQDYEHRWLINRETAEVVFWTSDCGIDGQHPVDLDDLDPELIAIDPLPSWIWYQDMADFAERISDKPAGRRLARALRGRGAFRHFKDELHEEYPHLVPVWYAFRDARAQHRAVEWLRHNDLVTAADAELFLAGHPEPEFP